MARLEDSFKTINNIIASKPGEIIITPIEQDPIIYNSNDLLKAASCSRIGMPELIKVNSSLKPLTIKLSQNSRPMFMQYSITNLEDKGSNVRYDCLVSDSQNGTYRALLPAEKGGCNIVLDSEGSGGNGIVVRSPILGATNKWIRIQGTRETTIIGDGATATNPVYSDPVLIPKVMGPIPPSQPKLTLTYSDSKTITGVVSNSEKSISDYDYSCVYTKDLKATTAGPFLPFSEYYGTTICKLNLDKNPISFSVDLSKLPDALKGQYFAIRVYKKGQADLLVFSQTLPLTDTQCRAPIKADFDFSKILLNPNDYKLTIPFKSMRTLATKPEALGWDKQTNDYTKSVTTISSVDSSSGKYAIQDLIDSTDKTDHYDYHIYNMCEGGVKSQSYC